MSDGGLIEEKRSNGQHMESSLSYLHVEKERYDGWGGGREEGEYTISSIMRDGVVGSLELYPVITQVDAGST